MLQTSFHEKLTRWFPMCTVTWPNASIKTKRTNAAVILKTIKGSKMFPVESYWSPCTSFQDIKSKERFTNHLSYVFKTFDTCVTSEYGGIFSLHWCHVRGGGRFDQIVTGDVPWTWKLQKRDSSLYRSVVIVYRKLLRTNYPKTAYSFVLDIKRLGQDLE